MAACPPRVQGGGVSRGASNPSSFPRACRGFAWCTTLTHPAADPAPRLRWPARWPGRLGGRGRCALCVRVCVGGLRPALISLFCFGCDSRGKEVAGGRGVGVLSLSFSCFGRDPTAAPPFPGDARRSRQGGRLPLPPPFHPAQHSARAPRVRGRPQTTHATREAASVFSFFLSTGHPGHERPPAAARPGAGHPGPVRGQCGGPGRVPGGDAVHTSGGERRMKGWWWWWGARKQMERARRGGACAGPRPAPRRARARPAAKARR